VVRYREMLRLAGAYKALPDVVLSIKVDYANALTNLGAVEERLGQRDAARAAYVTSISLYPTAQANYNLAVTHWGTDWDEVERLLQDAVRLDPSFEPARRELAAARYQRSLEKRLR
jgi:tetratricopeptide (TPR) repeat protein